MLLLLCGCESKKREPSPDVAPGDGALRGPACSNLTKEERLAASAEVDASERAREAAMRDAGLVVERTVFLRTGMEAWRGGGRPSEQFEAEREAAIARYAGRVTGDVVEVGGKTGVLVDRTTHPMAVIARRGDELVIAVPRSTRAIECAIPDEPQACHAPWERVVVAVPAGTTAAGVVELPFEHVRWQVIGGRLAVCPP